VLDIFDIGKVKEHQLTEFAHVEDECVTYPGLPLDSWFVVILVAAAGVLPSLHWSKRFTLRTLLIATTLVAVVLGLIVYVTRQ
jgi:hypothetical protein